MTWFIERGLTCEKKFLRKQHLRKNNTIQQFLFSCFLLYYNVLKQKSRFALGLDAAKNTHYIKKCFTKKLLSTKFRTKKSVDAYVYLCQEWSQLLSLKYVHVHQKKSHSVDMEHRCIYNNLDGYLLHVITVTKRRTECAKKLRRFPC